MLCGQGRVAAGFRGGQVAVKQLALEEVHGVPAVLDVNVADGAVIPVGARLRKHAHHHARGVADRSVETRGFHLHFGNRVAVRNVSHGAVDSHVRRAVQRPLVASHSAAHLVVRRRALSLRAHRLHLAAGLHARREHRQNQRAARGCRQAHLRPAVEHAPGRSRRGVQQRRRRGHRDRVRHRAQFQFQVHLRPRVHQQGNPFAHRGAETAHGGAHLVRAGQQEIDFVVSGFIRRGLHRGVCVHICNGDLRLVHRRGRRVEHTAEDRAASFLRPRRQAHQQRQESWNSEPKPHRRRSLRTASYHSRAPDTKSYISEWRTHSCVQRRDSSRRFGTGSPALSGSSAST